LESVNFISFYIAKVSFNQFASLFQPQADVFALANLTLYLAPTFDDLQLAFSIIFKTNTYNYNLYPF
jgi:hypothetical protein